MACDSNGLNEGNELNVQNSQYQSRGLKIALLSLEGK